MPYTVKVIDGKFCLYNTNTGRKLSKKYDSMNEAKAAMARLNNRGSGIRKYHACCRSGGCGKKGKKKTNKYVDLSKTSMPSVPKKLPKRKKSKKAVSKMLPNMHSAPKSTPKKLPVKKKKRRVALTQVVNNSGSGKKILTRGTGQGQRRAFKYFASDEFEKRARRMDRDIKDIAF